LACGRIEYFTNHWNPTPGEPTAVEIKVFSTGDPLISGSSLGCSRF